MMYVCVHMVYMYVHVHMYLHLTERSEVSCCLVQRRTHLTQPAASTTGIYCSPTLPGLLQLIIGSVTLVYGSIYLLF